MPDLFLDFSWEHPDPAAMQAAGVHGIFCYISPNPQGQFNTPSRAYIDDCRGRGISFSPIFEQGGEQPNEGYDRGRLDGERSIGWMDRIGVPHGVRLYVNMADTAHSGGHLTAIADYARGFAETFPAEWQLGSYGNLAALRASQQGSPRFSKLWAVEPWGAPPGSVEDHWQFWLGQHDVALVQMANVAPPLAGTDVNWLIPGNVVDGWGGTPPTVPGLFYPCEPPIRVNSPWGPRQGGFHYGLDLWAPTGSPVYACADGVVFNESWEPDGAGNHLAVYFDQPPTPAAPKYGYMHLQEFLVPIGAHVTAGQLVALADNTGASEGAHVHWWIGINANVGAIDPTPYLYGTGPPAPPINFHEIDAAIRALQGGSTMALVPNFLTHEISLLVNDQGELIHNARNIYGVRVVQNEVLATGCDRAVQPAARVDGQHLIVTVANTSGDERRLVFLAESGKWVSDPNVSDWEIGAPA